MWAEARTCLEAIKMRWAAWCGPRCATPWMTKQTRAVPVGLQVTGGYTLSLQKQLQRTQGEAAEVQALWSGQGGVKLGGRPRVGEAPRGGEDLREWQPGGPADRERLAFQGHLPCDSRW